MTDSKSSSTNYSRFTLFPIKYPTLFKFYETQRDAFWVPKEIDLESDIKDWRQNLTADDKHFLTHTLAFFAQADGIVLQNVNENFSYDVDIPEAKVFYGIQAGIEAIHWEMYSILIDTLIDTPKQKEEALEAIKHYPCIRKKAEWMLKWSVSGKSKAIATNTNTTGIDSTSEGALPPNIRERGSEASNINSSEANTEIPITQRLIAFACCEGIFFSSAFASIFYYKKRGLMAGLCLSNKFIARDEGIHRDFGCELFKILNRVSDSQIDPQIVYDIVSEAVEIECEFVDESLDVSLIGINKENMKDYVKFTADHLLLELGLNKVYNVQNPFSWMELISMTSKQNFFEGRVSEYKKTQSGMSFEIDTNF